MALVSDATNEVISQDDINKADEIKATANEQFKLGHYDKAQYLYTQAIDHNPKSHILHSNRSIAYLRTELYGYALDDADTAIKLNPSYTKAYYRRAAANMALGRFKKALKDFQLVHNAHPKDADAKKKYQECEKIWRQEAFAKAIAVDEKSIAESINFEMMNIEDSYDGPSLMDNKVTEQFMNELLDFYKNQKVLHKRYAFSILLQAREYFMQQSTMVEVFVPKGQKFTICGDIHGQFYDLLNIFKLNGKPSMTNPYLFNGDFVDRGSFSVETIFTLLGYKLLYPQHFFMSRGNHESHVMNQMYGFEGELKAKYNQQMADLFTETFNYLPLCHLVDSKIFVTHGGLFSKDGITLDDIKKENRVRQPPDEGIMTDLLWSDPQELAGRSPSKRGVGIQFGPDVTKAFLAANNLEYVIRSHEVKPEGYEKHHDDKCITVFSAPNYCDTMGNKGAFITFKGGERLLDFTSFEAVDHPQMRPMAYANSLFSMMAGM